MDEANVVMKDYKFKDVMKNHYSIMFFRRRVKTDECFLIKITPMDEHELNILVRKILIHTNIIKEKKELIKLFKDGLLNVQTP